MRISRTNGSIHLVGGPVPKGAAAITIGPVISVRSGHETSQRLMEHEEVASRVSLTGLPTGGSHSNARQSGSLDGRRRWPNLSGWTQARLVDRFSATVSGHLPDLVGAGPPQGRRRLTLARPMGEWSPFTVEFRGDTVPRADQHVGNPRNFR